MKFQTMKNKILFRILLASVLTVSVAIPAGPPTPTNTVQTLEGIRKKHNLSALAVVVVKDGQICDRAAVGIRK
jgi:Ni,Fe-hydrogenase III small subunit